jgi:hypothetical protein
VYVAALLDYPRVLCLYLFGSCAIYL